MAEYSNENKGVLFKEQDKKSDKAPDYTGKINSVCTQCKHEDNRRLAGWLRKSQNGNPLLSLAISEFQDKGYDSFKAQGEKLKAKVADVPDEPINLDDIPF